MFREIYRLVKRVIDFFWAFFGIIFMSPVFLLMAIAIKLDSPGPIFYTHPRVGKDGKVFTMYKFRSMVVGAREKIMKGAPESSVFTRLGRFLRPIHFDEFGQLLNVLKGDMAMIGPRAYDVEYHKVAHVAEGERWNERLKVKPGMTGLGQMLLYLPKQRERLIEMLPEHAKLVGKYRYIPFDLYYIQHENPLLDFWILCATFFLVVGSIIQHLSGIPLIEPKEHESTLPPTAKEIGPRKTI